MSLTTAEVAEVLGCPPATIRSHVRRGHLAQRRPGVFDEHEVNAFRDRRWRAEQKAARSRNGDVWAEIDKLVAAQAECVQR